MIYFKPGVLIDNIRPEMVVGMMVAHEAFRTEGADLFVTSANDRRHSEMSLHYAGQALDYRTHVLDDDMVKVSVVGLINKACPADFDCLLESIGSPNEHIHHEWQPKRSNR